MNKLLVLPVLALSSSLVLAQDFPGVTDATTFPSGLKYEGSIVKSRTWKDKNGTNHLLLTQSKVDRYTKYDEEMKAAYLYAYHFTVGTDGKLKVLRKIKDSVIDCEFDLTVRHIPEALRITDLDGDGIAEILMMYATACISDVSGPTLKLLLLENGDKYALRGTMVIKGRSHSVPGTQTVGPEFEASSTPSAFLEYARKLWNQYNTLKY